MTTDHQARTAAPAIEVTDLAKDYGDVRAVGHLTFAVEAGSITWRAPRSPKVLPPHHSR
jgi:hypothetical protein